MKSVLLILLLLPLAGCRGASRPPKPLTPAQRARKAAQAPHFATVPRPATRAGVLRSVEGSVLADARRQARAHRLEGPFVGASCTPIKEDRALAGERPRPPLLRFDCLAITFKSSTTPRMQIGTPFLARVDFARARYAWCLYRPIGGEGAHTASTFDVPPAPACAAPVRRR
jgi:hypothetical protein